MSDANRLSRPVVIALPGEIDAVSAKDVIRRLRCAFTPGGIVIADMAKTTLCDNSGTHELLKAHYAAKVLDCELRVARPSTTVMEVWMFLGADLLLTLYPTLAAARAGSGRGWGQHAAVVSDLASGELRAVRLIRRLTNV